ncbi:MAG: immune inhibitor A [Bacteroidetes bacterium]|nr:immune inhibitor A [Bacteroidota bacterium]MCL2302083.1 immune inhibitor A [Lentimicrobiaceae bacterium]
MKKNILLLCFLLVFGFSFAQEKQANYARVKVYVSEKEHFKVLLQKGVCLENIEIKQGVYIIGEFSDFEMEKIRETQIPFEILIENMFEHYVRQNDGYSVERLNEEMRKGAKSFKSNRTPSNFRLGSMGGYFTLAEIMTELDEMRAKFPRLISAKIAFPEQTAEGRNIYWVRISNNPNVDQEKPRVLYTALTHAREPAGMHQMIYQMWDLLEKYGEDPEITYYIDNLEIYFMPCLNPDGYEYNRRSRPNGGGMWRKNMKANADGSYGVDLNRNWGYKWGLDNIGSSHLGISEIYRGTAPFSEAETQVLKNFCENREILLCLNNHTHGNYLIYPYGYTNATPPEYPIYRAYAERLTSENNYAYGTCYEVLGYLTNGDADDWMHGEQETKNQIFALTPEAGNREEAFWPPMNRIEEICAGHVTMNKYMMRFALPYAEIEDKTGVSFQSLDDFFVFELFSLGQGQNVNFSVSIEPVSDNIQLVQATPFVFQNVNILERKQGELSIAFKPDITSGDEVVFDVCVNNGTFTHKYRFTKIFGAVEKLIDDDCETMNNWISDTWGLTTLKYVSPLHSIADSPHGNYANNANTIIYSKNSYDLSNAIVAFVEFDAQWDIELDHDYVQFIISENNGATWTPLAGKYTKLGTKHQDQGKPVYDGTQNSWVRETIDLMAYKGKYIRVGFRLISDEHMNKDGFYFDNFELSVVRRPPKFPNKNSFTAQYIANTKKIAIYYIDKATSFSLFNVEGKLLKNFEVNSRQYELDVSQLQAGVYFLRTNSREVQKIIVY